MTVRAVTINRAKILSSAGSPVIAKWMCGVPGWKRVVILRELEVPGFRGWSRLNDGRSKRLMAIMVTGAESLNRRPGSLST